jgi:TRAP-type C4-dicarboxylate transport system substrate-binding protein
MMMIIRRNIILAGILAAAGLAGSIGASHAQTVTLRYAHVGSAGDIQHWYAEQAAIKIPEATNGRVAVTVFPDSQLGGVITMGHHEFASLARLSPNIAVFNAPFVYRDGEHALAATDPANSEVLQEFNEGLASESNMRIIGRLYRGARNMTANMEVKSPDDLAGKPFRGVPLQLWTTMIRGFGAIPTPVEVAELPTALMTGIVVGQENPLTMINANRLYEVQSHVMMTAHMQNVLPVFINESTWQSISEEDREAILAVLDELADQTLEQAQSSEAELIQTLEGHGMTFVTQEDGLDIERFRNAVSAEVERDFPDWKPYMDRIAEIR